MHILRKIEAVCYWKQVFLKEDASGGKKATLAEEIVCQDHSATYCCSRHSTQATIGRRSFRVSFQSQPCSRVTHLQTSTAPEFQAPSSFFKITSLTIQQPCLELGWSCMPVTLLTSSSVMIFQLHGYSQRYLHSLCQKWIVHDH